MPYTVHVIAVKPENSQWFIDIDPDIVQKIRDWMNLMPGLIDHHVTEVDDDTIITSFTWDNESSYLSYLEAREKNEDWNVRERYCLSVGMTQSIVIE